MSSQKKKESQNSVADQIRYHMEKNPISLDNIQYGEVIFKVRDGRIVHMNVNHAYKLDSKGANDGDDTT